MYVYSFVLQFTSDPLMAASLQDGYPYNQPGAMSVFTLYHADTMVGW